MGIKNFLSKIDTTFLAVFGGSVCVMVFVAIFLALFSSGILSW